MRRSPLPALVLFSALALAGCSEDPEPKFADPSPTSSASASSSPSESAATPSYDEPPVMPEAAKKHTKAGAEAFVRHFVEVTNYAQLNADPHAIADLVSPTCPGCQGAVEFAQELKDRRATVKGGESTPHNLRSRQLRAGELRLMDVTFELSNTRQVITWGDTGEKDIYPAARGTQILTLQEQEDGWMIVGTDFR